MQAVFVSSIQTGYEEVRDAARRAIEALQMRALLAESAGARAVSPQRALLDVLRGADVVVLILGATYSKPAEDEFDEARRLGIPILVLKQDVEPEPQQQAFIDRVGGGWKGGRYWKAFTDADDLFAIAVEALAAVSNAQQRREHAPAAMDAARRLATGEDRLGFAASSVARIAFAPFGNTQILDAVGLDERLAEALASMVRDAGLVPHSVGIVPTVSRAGVSISYSPGERSSGVILALQTDGALVCEFDVGGESSYAGTRVDSLLLERGIRSSGELALVVWDRIDQREDIQHMAIALAIPDAEHKVYGLPENPGSYSISMGLPPTVLVPEPPVIARRADIGGDRLVERLVAEVRAVFADAGALFR